MIFLSVILWSSHSRIMAIWYESNLNVRIATPPFDRAKNGWADVNPGVASSYIFSLKEGDPVTISGPYGEFFINHSEAEMLYVGGGAGMAPMRSHLYHLFRTLKTGRKVTFWYGGRSKRELFYIEHFRALERDFPNFKFYVALSEPSEEDNWKVKDGLDGEGDGFIGFVHQVVIDNYLDHHESPCTQGAWNGTTQNRDERRRIAG